MLNNCRNKGLHLLLHALELAFIIIRQHTSAYVSIRHLLLLHALELSLKSLDKLKHLD